MIYSAKLLSHLGDYLGERYIRCVNCRKSFSVLAWNSHRDLFECRNRWNAVKQQLALEKGGCRLSQTVTNAFKERKSGCLPPGAGGWFLQIEEFARITETSGMVIQNRTPARKISRNVICLSKHGINFVPQTISHSQSRVRLLVTASHVKAACLYLDMIEHAGMEKIRA